MTMFFPIARGRDFFRWAAQRSESGNIDDDVGFRDNMNMFSD